MSSKMTDEERRMFQEEYDKAKAEVDAEKKKKRDQAIRDFAKQKAKDDSTGFFDKLTEGLGGVATKAGSLMKEVAENTNVGEEETGKKKKKKDKAFMKELEETIL